MQNNYIGSISIDSVIFGFEEDQLKVLLIKRNVDKDSDTWGLPGGYVNFDEDIEHAAERVLEERTGVKVYMKQFGAFGKVNRVPEERYITIAYYALVKPGSYKLKRTKDDCDVSWVNVYDLPKLLYDHNIIIEFALDNLRQRIRTEPIGFNLLPQHFPLLALQRLYEVILNTSFDKPNFRSKLLKMKLLIKLDEKQNGVAHRSAHLFKFDKERYDALIQKGFNFEL
jgi:8-oxo-dGTP diphosphatase